MNYAPLGGAAGRTASPVHRVHNLDSRVGGRKISVCRFLSRFCRGAGALSFPGSTHRFAPRENIFLGILEVLVDPLALDHVARTAAGY